MVVRRFMNKKIIRTELIAEYIKENNLSKKKFCVLCKISVVTSNKVLSGKTNINFLAIFKIAKVMNINAYKLFYE